MAELSKPWLSLVRGVETIGIGMIVVET